MPDDLTDRLMEFSQRVRAASARAATDAGTHDGPLFAACAELLARLLAENPARDQAECGKNCHFCCHQQVLVSATEAAVIALVLCRELEGAALAQVRDRLAVRAAQAAPLSAAAHWRARLPCAFLDEEGGCRIHAVRPLVCRGYLSHARSACQEKYVADSAPLPPIDRYAHLAGNAVLSGLRDALQAAGRDARLVELHAAVLAALN